MYNVDYFIKKFEAIPEENWTVGVYEDGDKCCAMGHCGIRDDFSVPDTYESRELFRLIFSNYSCHVTNINDGEIEGYQQPTPKQRILAALYDIKKLEQPQYDNITKEIAALPIQPEVSDVAKQKISWLL